MFTSYEVIGDEDGLTNSKTYKYHTYEEVTPDTLKEVVLGHQKKVEAIIEKILHD